MPDVRRRSFFRDQSGMVAVMSAALLPCVIGGLAFAVDIASLHVERRKMQAMADLAALAAATDLAHAQEAALSLLRANGAPADVKLQVEKGLFRPDPTIAPKARYTSPAAGENAVKIALETTGQIYFSRLFYPKGGPSIRVSAIAAKEDVSQFSVGSRLLSLKEGVANAILSKMFGSKVNLTLMDYNALAAADIDLLKLLGTMATDASITAGSYNSFLSSNLRVGAMLDAAAHVAAASGRTAADLALRKLRASGTIASLRVDGRKLLDLGKLGPLALGETPAGLKAFVSAYDLVRAAASAGGNHQLSLDLGVEVPLLGGLTADVMLGEPPQSTSWVTVGARGAKVYTAQTRVKLNAILGNVPLVAPVVTLPVLIDVAAAEADLASISCGSDPGKDVRVTLNVQPSLARAWIGEVADPAQWNSFAPVTPKPATVLNVIEIVKVTASSSAQIKQNVPIPVPFTAAEINSGTIKNTSSNRLLTSLVSDLFADPKVEGELLGLRLFVGLNNLVRSVKNLILPVGKILDPIVDSLLITLGVSVGQADVRVHAVRCGTPALVM
ncbi:pilus assembly protein TadG-related protein [Terrihabitans sp. B22-R8]|uniref:pilus assembly protein TadG-related protein n=1 Tax=Terrihabitans sp. B22-R8 TaxID=3425128 RepID=UPI00403C8D5F